MSFRIARDTAFRLRRRPASVPREIRPPRPGMVWIPGGVFLMGSDRHYREEGPAHVVQVDPFWMDRHPVTNNQFRRFVEATGHVTVAEERLDPRDYPGAPFSAQQPGSLVFVKPSGPIDLGDPRYWWIFTRQADWQHPQGPHSSIEDLGDHPVVHVAYRDAEAFAAWAGKQLPTEAEWEFAARGGLEGAEFPWGDKPNPGGRFLANFWQGEFPWQNLASDGYGGTSPVNAFPPNRYGLHDMVGNVWEWTADWYRPRHVESHTGGTVLFNPHGGRMIESLDPVDSVVRMPRKVLKGGSHLCARNYSYRYRPAARLGHPIAVSASDVGFRCIVRVRNGD